jgi:sulfur-oxidizing protein SoxX
MVQRIPKLFMSLRFSRLPIAGFAAVLVMGALSAQGATPERVAAGKSLAMERSKGNCLACHRIADGKLPGTIGPPLVAMKLRFPERAALREQICDATIRNPNSRMPPFCRHRILAESDVELIIDYLYTL